MMIQIRGQPRADFSYSVHNHVVAVADRCTGRSVTNDAEYVIATLAANFDLSEYRVIYRDTRGIWDEILVQDACFAGFCAINEPDLDKALAKIGAAPSVIDNDAAPCKQGPTPTCVSGGADGADLEWAAATRAAGHKILHYSFAGHQTRAAAADVVQLTQAQLKAADGACERANVTLRRVFPPAAPYVANLLRRNWYQINRADACYAVASLANSEVVGGTAWAVQMFIDRHDSAACACYVFCQNARRWHRWIGHWEAINRPPVPMGIWTGIGSRALRHNGMQAIHTLLNNTRTAS